MVCGVGCGKFRVDCAVGVVGMVDVYGVDCFECDFFGDLFGTSAEDVTLFPVEQGAFGGK